VQQNPATWRMRVHPDDLKSLLVRMRAVARSKSEANSSGLLCLRAVGARALARFASTVLGGLRSAARERLSSLVGAAKLIFAVRKGAVTSPRWAFVSPFTLRFSFAAESLTGWAA
jgi:hypothetical protein